MKEIKFVVKRNGEKVSFDLNKIQVAIEKAGKSTGEFDGAQELLLARSVARKLKEIPTVEYIQDEVESVLLNHGYH